MKIVSVIWCINIQLTISCKPRSDVDIQVRSNVVLDICVVCVVRVWCVSVVCVWCVFGVSGVSVWCVVCACV